MTGSRGRTTPRGPVRVQKYLSQAGAASRRQAEVMMREGRIAINGTTVTEMGVRVTPGVDTVSLDGRVVVPAPRRWIVFHKPTGVLCTRTDPHGGTRYTDCFLIGPKDSATSDASTGTPRGCCC